MKKINYIFSRGQKAIILNKGPVHQGMQFGCPFVRSSTEVVYLAPDKVIYFERGFRNLLQFLSDFWCALKTLFLAWHQIKEEVFLRIKIDYVSAETERGIWLTIENEFKIRCFMLSKVKSQLYYGCCLYKIFIYLNRA